MKQKIISDMLPGGVCPFGIKDGVKVYLDESLKRYDTVYPAAGNDHSAVKLTIVELEEVAGACGWIAVCKQIRANMIVEKRVIPIESQSNI